MNRVLFIRHGATPGNEEKRYIGRTDECLSELGIQQALSIWDRQFQPNFLFVSPARRTIQTAELAFPGAFYVEEPGLWETDFGIFEGKTAQELSGDSRYQAWVDSNCTAPIPQGESIDDFKARCVEAFQRCMSTVPDGRSVAFVIHGGAIMAVMEALAQPKKSFYDYHIPNGKWMVCIYENGILRT